MRIDTRLSSKTSFKTKTNLSGELNSNLYLSQNNRINILFTIVLFSFWVAFDHNSKLLCSRPIQRTSQPSSSQSSNVFVMDVRTVQYPIPIGRMSTVRLNASSPTVVRCSPIGCSKTICQCTRNNHPQPLNKAIESIATAAAAAVAVAGNPQH